MEMTNFAMYQIFPEYSQSLILLNYTEQYWKPHSEMGFHWKQEDGNFFDKGLK